MISEKEGGMVIFNVEKGEVVEEGEKIEKVVKRKGEKEGDIEINEKKEGRIMKRSQMRYVSSGDDILKIMDEKNQEVKKREGEIEE